MEEKNINEIAVDQKNKVVTNPAYMKGTARPHEVYDGIGEMIKKVLSL